MLFRSTDPIYKEYFSEVWLWMDFPKRGNMPDTGIDLVAVIRDTGDYCAIQCKCYAENQTLEKSDRRRTENRIKTIRRGCYS